MDIFKRLEELNFPNGEYVVAGGTMFAHGMREAHDLDILVTPKLYEKLLKSGWVMCVCEQCTKTNRFMLNKGDVDILPDFTFGGYTGDVDWLINNPDIIQGYPFMNLVEFAKLKKELGRPKDIEDIKLIEQYLKSA